jgi:predicted AlkP superfamily pyrophosphatase or phosphodiesterase
VQLGRQTKIADDAPGEGGLHGMGISFPHVVHDFEELLHTPFGDEIVLDTALAALDAMQLGTDEVPDLLAISLNAHDYAGHNWGPDSWEVLDLTLRLDAALGALFTTLDRKLGKDGWAVVLTSDHGATPVVDRSPVSGAKRFSPTEIAKEGGPLIARIVSNQAFMTSAWAQLPPAEQQAARTSAADAIRKRYPEIDVFDTADTSRCTERSLAGEVCRGTVDGVSGELYLAPKRGFVITEYKTGTHHDAPNPDNQHVPILVRAPGLAPQTIDRASLLQVAPTVTALLGVPPPGAATEKPLFGIEARSRARP